MTRGRNARSGHGEVDEGYQSYGASEGRSSLTGSYALVGIVLAPVPLGRTEVVIEGGKIRDVVRSSWSEELPSERRESSGFICPGFIDLQINGAFGIDAGPDTKDLEALVRELPKTGVTYFLPTAVSWPAELYADFLNAIKEAPSSPGAAILGAHIEEPFLALARKCAHDSANLQPVDRKTPGADADLVVLSREGMVEETIVAGETVYHGRGESHVW